MLICGRRPSSNSNTRICALARISPPADRTLDGHDLRDALLEDAPSPRHEIVYYRNRVLHALRVDAYKAHFVSWRSYVGEQPVAHDPPLLYDLDQDPSERFDVAAKHPEVVAAMTARRDEILAEIEMPPSRLDVRGDG